MITKCQICGKKFSVYPSRVKWGRGKTCSRTCQYKLISNKLAHKIVLNCIGCGRTFTRSPSAGGGIAGKGKYCSRACRDIFRIGTAHPGYINGGLPYRGPNWHSQRRKAYYRDRGICRHCKEIGTAVHHIRPYRLFNDDYIAANDLSNLITLCSTCHRKAEAGIK